ncbi:hypothetical protein Dsin_008589 [Dipteronia sinensis]|uniref:RNase H type-1 domain-containing protein n=1 Tax=Dipteronia sinensis TaxID=43782 RepID=A0AAE0AQ40_9ROSI|nr:hypothetical protein Dsin_008589 [Dipteronia sinensis]
MMEVSLALEYPSKGKGWVAGLLREFQNTQGTISGSGLTKAMGIAKGWLPPPASCVKLNTDAVVKPGSNHIGIGAVIHNSDWRVLVASSQCLDVSFSVETGELLALIEGLLLAKRHDFLGCWVELDAVNAVLASNSSNGVVGFVFDDIVTLCTKVQVSKCQAIPRSGNNLAHNLASEGFSSKRDWWWQDAC